MTRASELLSFSLLRQVSVNPINPVNLRVSEISGSAKQRRVVENSVFNRIIGNSHFESISPALENNATIWQSAHWYEDINRVQVDADYLRLWSVTNLVPELPMQLFQQPVHVRLGLSSS